MTLPPSVFSTHRQMSRRILIVDDEQFLLRTLTRALSKSTNHEIAGVDCVREVREALVHFRPDLVVCDLELGDGTGLDVLDLLRRHGLSIPFIVLSGYVDAYADALPDDPRVVIRRKPLRASELIALVEAQLVGATREGSQVFSVSDYLQMAHFSRRSLRVTVRCRTGESGMVEVWEGDPWNARCGHEEGLEALAKMLTAPPMALATTPLPESPATRQIQLPTSALLLDLAKRSDDAARHRGPTPEPELAPATDPSAAEPMTAFITAMTQWQLPEAAAHLREARRHDPSDARLQAWWCDLLLARWDEETRLRNGGAA